MTEEEILIEEYKRLSQIFQLQAEKIQLLTEQVDFLKDKLLSQSKETMEPSLSGQLSLFDDQK